MQLPGTKPYPSIPFSGTFSVMSGTQKTTTGTRIATTGTQKIRTVVHLAPETIHLLDKEVAGSGDVYVNRAHLVRRIIHQHVHIEPQHALAGSLQAPGSTQRVQSGAYSVPLATTSGPLAATSEPLQATSVPPATTFMSQAITVTDIETDRPDIRVPPRGDPGRNRYCGSCRGGHHSHCTGGDTFAKVCGCECRSSAGD